MAYIQDPFRRPRDQPGHNHSFNHQVRNVLHQKAVLDGSRLALIGVAHDIFLRARGVSNNFPFRSRRESGASHAAQTRGFEYAQDGLIVAAFHKLTDGLVRTRAGIGIRRQSLWVVIALRYARCSTFGRLKNHLQSLSRSYACKNMIVDRQRGSCIATPEAGDCANADFTLLLAWESFLE